MFKQTRIVFKTKKKLFVTFPLAFTSTEPGGFMVCVYLCISGAPEGSTDSDLENPGIEPATNGLQGIALIYNTTAA